MTAAVSIDGVLVPVGEARVSVFDRGFLYGDSVYEVVRTYDLEPFEVGAHLARLAASAQRIFLPLPWSGDRVEREIRRVVEASRATTTTTTPRRLPGTRVSAPSGSSSPAAAARWGSIPRSRRSPRSWSLRFPFAARPSLRTGRVSRPGPSVAPARPPGVATRARRPGSTCSTSSPCGRRGAHEGHEALLVDRAGCVTEGASSNVFAVRGDVLETPPLQAGILAGVTRACVIELALELGIQVREQPLPLASLADADEAFLTSTVREILPLVRVGSVPVGSGTPGPVTNRLHAAFRYRAGGGHKPGKGPGPG